jgi:hypothetical protein
VKSLLPRKNLTKNRLQVLVVGVHFKETCRQKVKAQSRMMCMDVHGCALFKVCDFLPMFSQGKSFEFWHHDK